MSDENVLDLIRVYLDGNSKENQEISYAESKLLEIGHSITPILVNGLNRRLQEYRQYAITSSELRAFGKQPAFNVYQDEAIGVSPVQRVVSQASVTRAVELVEKLGDSCVQNLCLNLFGKDISASLATSLILFNLQKPSPYVVKAIVASRHLYIDLPYQSPPNHVLFYLLLGILVHTGDVFALKILNEDLKEDSIDLDNFSKFIQDMAIYFISLE